MFTPTHADPSAGSVPPAPARSPLPRLPGWLAVLLAACLVALGMWPVFRLSLEPDTAWLLHAADALLNGAVYGVDIVEVNPPLIVWICMIPALGARVTGLAPGAVYHALVGIVALASTLLVTRLSRHHPILGPGGGAPWVCLFVLTVLFLPPGLAFGQREHLAVALVLPYACLSAIPPVQRPRSRSLPLGVGVLAGVGFALKPFFLFPLVLLELSRWRAGRLFPRTELRVVVAFGVTYVAAALVLHPEWWDTMLRMGPVYRAYLVPSPRQILYGASTTVVVLAVLGAAWPLLAPTRIEGGRWSTALAAGAAGFTLSVLVQWKVWDYLFVPVLGLATLALGWLVVEARVSRSVPRAAAWLAAGMVVVQVTARLHEATYWFRQAEASPASSTLAEIVRRAGDGNPILVLSTNHLDAFPLALDVGRGWGSRYPSLWPLLVYHRDQLAPRASLIDHPAIPEDPRETAFLAEVAEDIVRYRPGVLVVPRADPQSSRRGFSLRFDYMRLLGADSALSRLLANYVPVDSTDAYLMLARDPAVPPAPSPSAGFNPGSR